jgi:hypothetical protein
MSRPESISKFAPRLQKNRSLNTPAPATDREPLSSGGSERRLKKMLGMITYGLD